MASFKIASAFKSAVDNISALESIIMQSFGPNGLDTALKTETGSIIVTNCGRTILSSISLSHPVGRMILGQVQSHAEITGDNSKTFIMVLSELLRNLYEGVLINSKIQNISPELARLSNACASLCGALNKEAPISLKTIYNNFNHDPSDFNQRIKGLITTTLNGKFPPRIISLLAEQLLEIVLRNCSCTTNFLEHIQHLIADFPDICVQVHGLGTENSAVKDGFLLKQEPTGRLEPGFLANPINFLCINDGFDLEKLESSKLCFSLDQFKTNTYIEIRSGVIKRFANKLQENGIKLILCSSGLPDYVHFILKSKLCIIQHVGDEEIKRICCYLGIMPLENFNDVFQDDISIHRGTFTGAERVVIGTERYFSVTPANNCKSDRPCCYLILCAPSSGICQQYFKAIFNALKVLRMAFWSKYGDYQCRSDSLAYVPGAGASEIAIGTYFDDIALNTEDQDQQIVARSLSQALLSVPRNLHRCSNSQHKLFIDTITTIKDKYKAQQTNNATFYGINGRSGGVFEPLKDDVIEPYSSKILLIDHVLQAAQQILRIDFIVPSKCIKLQ